MSYHAGKHKINGRLKVLGGRGVQTLGVCAGLGNDLCMIRFRLLSARGEDVFRLLLRLHQGTFMQAERSFLRFGKQAASLLLRLAVLCSSRFFNS